MTTLPAPLPLAALTALERRFVEAIGFHRGARPRLRNTVRVIAAGLAENGVPRAVARRVVQFIAENQAAGAIDRLSVLGREPRSAALMRDMLGWIDDEYLACTTIPSLDELL